MQAKIDIEVQDSLKLVLENVKRNHPRLKFTFSKEKKRNSTHFNFAYRMKLLISEKNYLKFV